MDQGNFRLDRMEDLEFRNEAGGLWIEDIQSRIEDSTMLHPHLIKIFCRELRYFEVIYWYLVKLGFGESFLVTLFGVDAQSTGWWSRLAMFLFMST